ncbi:MAG: efflux RND transporter periplasmic adaptor subunit [Acidobacteria bacterium]|nr:efflux RND transporter periplasmic adaptor subunit [Acidobacteriota bacterium]
MTPGRRKLAARAALIVVLLGAGWGLRARAPLAQGPTATVHREDLPITVEAVGELDAVRSSLIGPPAIPNSWDFKISFMAPESRQVKQGEPILAFDTTAMQSEHEKRKVEYEVALKDIEKRRAELDLSVADLEQQLDEARSRLRKNTLKADRPDDLVGMVELKLARLDRELAEKEVASLGIRVERARASGEADLEGLERKRDYAATRTREIEGSIAKMKIAAPQDGIVIYQTDWQGDKKKVGDSIWRNLKVLKLPDLSEMMGKADVDEPDAGNLKVGDPVSIHLDALPDATLTGKLTSIGRVVQQASRGSTLKVYKIEFSLDRTDPSRMRPGMRLRADVEVDRAPRALVVPQEAIVLTAGGPALFVRRGGRFEESPVRLGRRDGGLVEVLDGAAEGDVVSVGARGRG